MLVTWIRDVYSFDERAEMRTGIDTIASPNEHNGFASNGVYVFFDPVEKRVLYIGLARDLSERFAHHNGLVKMAEAGCKVARVREWFQTNPRLGYAMLVQSPFSQAGVGRQRGRPTAAFYDEESSTFWDYDDEGLTHIADVEAQMIAAYTERFGVLPPWNQIQGAVTAFNRPTRNSYAMLELAIGLGDSLLLSRATIRDLAADPGALAMEEAMHLGRFEAAARTGGQGVDTLVIIQTLQDLANMPEYADTGLVEVWNHMCEVDYFRYSPPPPAAYDVPGRVPPRPR